MKNRVIVVTRPSHMMAAIAKSIRKRGGVPYLLPTLRVDPLNNRRGLRRLLSELEAGRVDYIVFMSVNGVNHFQRLLRTEGPSGPPLRERGVRVVAVGPSTAAALERTGLKVWRFPDVYTSEGVVELLSTYGQPGQTVFLVRALGSPKRLNRKLRELGFRVRQLSVYRLGVPSVKGRVKRFLELVRAGKIDAIIFGSPSSVKNFLQLLPEGEAGERVVEALNARVIKVAIGPVTARAMGMRGLKVDMVPERATYDSALDTLEAYWAREEAGAKGWGPSHAPPPPAASSSLSSSV